MKLNLDIDKDAFRIGLMNQLDSGHQHLGTIVLDLIITEISASLKQQFGQEQLIGYKFQPSYTFDIHSIRAAIDKGGFDLRYLTIQIDLQLGMVIEENDIEYPSVMRWLPVQDLKPQEFRFKHKRMKTRERFTIKLYHLQVPAEVFEPVLKRLACSSDCEPHLLSPEYIGVWNWWQSFACVVCGESYFCECFRVAIEKSKQVVEELPPKFVTENAKYRSRVCHLCSGRPSSLVYCHPMYGNQIKVNYGAYMKKFSIAEDISEYAAENKVRDILSVRHIGEGWVSETLLYRLVATMFAEYQVIREATPDWLGKQRLDIFIPDLNIAIEYQGEQHYRPVELFGGNEGFKKTRERDRIKKKVV